MLHRSKCLLPLENERHAPNARAPVAAAERAAETKKSDHGLELPIAIMLTPCSGCRMLSTSALVWLRASQTNQQDASNRETSYAYPITEDATPEWLHLPRSPTIWVIWHSICGPHPHLSCQILTDGIPVKSTPSRSQGAPLHNSNQKSLKLAHGIAFAIDFHTRNEDMRALHNEAQ
jgi:hypothetical protein